jgi:peroxiredoxin Q/BCP
VNVGDRIMDLPVALGSGRTANLSDYTGRWLVLYFYPKDNTPGCTTEGIEFNAVYPRIRKAGGDLLGVSRDSVRSHANFCKKHGFVFDLVSDADEAICRAFGVIKPKKLYGRDYIGIERSTFLIDPKGRVAESWRGVKVAGHAEEVLSALQKAAKAK